MFILNLAGGPAREYACRAINEATEGVAAMRGFLDMHHRRVDCRGIDFGGRHRRLFSTPIEDPADKSFIKSAFAGR